VHSSRRDHVAHARKLAQRPHEQSDPSYASGSLSESYSGSAWRQTAPHTLLGRLGPFALGVRRRVRARVDHLPARVDPDDDINGAFAAAATAGEVHCLGRAGCGGPQSRSRPWMTSANDAVLAHLGVSVTVGGTHGRPTVRVVGPEDAAVEHVVVDRRTRPGAHVQFRRGEAVAHGVVVRVCPTTGATTVLKYYDLDPLLALTNDACRLMPHEYAVASVVPGATVARHVYDVHERAFTPMRRSTLIAIARSCGAGGSPLGTEHGRAFADVQGVDAREFVAEQLVILYASGSWWRQPSAAHATLVDLGSYAAANSGGGR